MLVTLAVTNPVQRIQKHKFIAENCDESFLAGKTHLCPTRNCIGMNLVMMILDFFFLLEIIWSAVLN